MRRILALALLAGCSTDSGSQTGSTSDLITINNNDNCTAHVHLSVAVDTTATTPQARFAAENCRVDADACVDLCNYEMSNLTQIQGWVNGIPAPNAFGGLPGGGVDIGPGGFPTQQTGLTADQCHVTFDGETANSDIHYDTFNPGANCGFASAGGTGSGSATPGGL